MPLFAMLAWQDESADIVNKKWQAQDSLNLRNLLVKS